MNIYDLKIVEESNSKVDSNGNIEFGNPLPEGSIFVDRDQFILEMVKLLLEGVQKLNKRVEELEQKIGEENGFN